MLPSALRWHRCGSVGYSGRGRCSLGLRFHAARPPRPARHHQTRPHPNHRNRRRRRPSRTERRSRGIRPAHQCYPRRRRHRNTGKANCRRRDRNYRRSGIDDRQAPQTPKDWLEWVGVLRPRTASSPAEEASTPRLHRRTHDGTRGGHRVLQRFVAAVRSPMFRFRGTGIVSSGNICTVIGIRCNPAPAQDERLGDRHGATQPPRVTAVRRSTDKRAPRL